MDSIKWLNSLSTPTTGEPNKFESCISCC